MKNVGGNYVYNITKNSTMRIISEDESSLTYRPLNIYDMSAIPLSEAVFSPNFDALSLWWQMTNAPSWLVGW